MPRDLSLWLIGAAASLVVHGGLAIGALYIPDRPLVQENAIEVVQRTLPKRKKKPKPKPPEKKPEPKKAEPTQPDPPKKTKRVVRKRPAKAPPKQPEPEGKPDVKTPPAPDTGAKTFGIEMEGATAAPGTGVAVPKGQSLRTDPKIRRIGKGKPPKKGFKKVYKRGELAPVAVITTRPKVKKVVQPRYPARMRELEVEGRVLLQLTIDENGKVVAAKVLKSLRKELDDEAIRAALKMLFAPATVNGTAVKLKIRYTFTFVLD